MATNQWRNDRIIIWQTIIASSKWKLKLMGKSLMRNGIFTSFFLGGGFRATPLAYGGSQARGWIGATADSLHHSHSNAGIWAASVTYTTAQGNVRPLTHWARPGIEPTSSWILVGFINHWARKGTPSLFKVFKSQFQFQYLWLVYSPFLFLSGLVL